MPELPPEFAALRGLAEVFALLTPEQQQSFIDSLRGSRNEEPSVRQESPDLALEAGSQPTAAPGPSGVLDHLRAILEELGKPANSLSDMPRRIELCRQALSVVGREKNPQLWARLHTILADCLRQDPQGNRGDNLEQAIAHYMQALEVQTRQAYPEYWAMTHNGLAMAYFYRLDGVRADNLEQAIGHYTQALEVYTQQAYPVEWAMTHSGLTIAYSNRREGEREENLEQAIAHAEQALEVYTRQAYPEYWARRQFNLGNAYAHRLRGERAENIEQAIAHYTYALEVFTQQAYPEGWATIQRDLGNAYRERVRGGLEDNLEQAIAHYALALEVYTREAYPEGWASTHIDLGNAYEHRQRERAENLERAIFHFKQALEVHTKPGYPEEWARAQNGLAVAYTARMQGERAENLEQAIAHAEHALEVYTREAYPERWARTQFNLGNAYANRLRGERAENIEQAIAYFRQTLEVYTRQAYSEYWAMTHTELAMAYVDRLVGVQADNLEQAIAHYTQALEVYTREAYPEGWALAHSGLAVSYSYRRRNGGRAENLEQAIAHAEQALEVYTQHAYPGYWAMTQDRLATAYAQRLRGERAENIEQAIAHYTYALEVYTQQAYPEGWAATRNNLAIAYSTRIRGERAENIEQALAHYAQALQVRTLERLPADYQITQRSLGHLHFGEKRWSEALTAYREAIRAEKVLLAAAYTEAGRLAEMWQTSELYARATYALAKLNRAGEALGQLEQGKARLLARALALNDLDLSLLPAEQQERLRTVRQRIRWLETEMHRYLGPDTGELQNKRTRIEIGGRTITLADVLEQARAELNGSIESVRRAHPDFSPEGLELGEILALIPEDSALVAPVITSQGTAVFIVPAGLQSVSADQVFWLNDFKDVDLKTMLLGPSEEQWGGWLGAYFNARSNAEAWLDIIETTGRTLWDRLIGPIAVRLASLHAKHLLLMPQGGLGLLPVHAAWREIDGTRRYLIDDYAISYVTSAYAQRVSLDRLQDVKRQVRTLFAIVNPTEDLPFTPAEGEQVASLFGEKNSTVLPGNKATSSEVKQGVASYFHFACHGFYVWQDPMQSGLVLAKGERLTLAQIVGRLDLGSTRLVTLSACETGLTEISQSPDEYLGLPTGFLRAGAPAVVSSLWTVNDLSTSLLMAKFYTLHLRGDPETGQGPMAPAHALRCAQHWLRDGTAERLRLSDRWEALYRSSDPPDPYAYRMMRYCRANPTARLFASPYFWAAFTFSGA